MRAWIGALLLVGWAPGAWVVAQPGSGVRLGVARPDTGTESGAVGAGAVGAVGAAGETVPAVRWICRIGVRSGWPAAALHVAEREGMWRAQGVEGEVLAFADPLAMEWALRRGRIDAVVDDAALALSWGEGWLVFLAETGWSEGGWRLVARPGVTMSQLKETGLGLPADRPAAAFLLHKMLLSQGIAVADVPTREAAPDQLATELAEGKMGAALLPVSLAEPMEREGRGVALSHSGLFPGSVPAAMVCRAQWLDAMPPEAVAGWLKGIAAANVWLNDPEHEDAALRLCRTRAPLGGAVWSDEALLAERAGFRIPGPEEMALRNTAITGLGVTLAELAQFGGRLTAEGRRFDFRPEFLQAALRRERIPAPGTGSSGMPGTPPRAIPLN